MTTGQRVTRKLKAILSADVKGYSILMADDEVHTVKKLKEYRDRMSSIIQSHSGRVVDAVGDNLLADFSSAVNAVQCAVEVQKRLKDKNQKLPGNREFFVFILESNSGLDHSVWISSSRCFSNSSRLACAAWLISAWI